MDHTIKDVAEAVGVTKVASFQHFQRIRKQLSKHIRHSKNRILLDDKAYYRLLNSFKGIKNNGKRSSNSKATLTALRLLKAELKDKDKSINDLTKQNTNLTEMLKHQQELQLNEQKRNRQLGQTLSRTLKLNYKKHGFWWRFTHLFSH